MEAHRVLWGLLTLIVTASSHTEFCEQNPPEVSNATFRALQYKMGTLVLCDCERGFRRQGAAFLNCTGNASHTFWANRCHCRRMLLISPQSEEEKERKPTESLSQTQPRDHLPGHCLEPPPWEHEKPTRSYNFVVGQEVLYRCTQGPGAPQGGSSWSVCMVSCGKKHWTKPQVNCRKDALTPGEEPPAASPKDPPEGDITCTPTTRPTVPTDTTGSQEPTDTTTTAETFTFTTKFQIAVAICLLLLGILLLSGLAWQWRWRNSRGTI
ncbi:interleukin-2 receptor subunit alpha isoform X2 [Erinaceus europaeus]|uniref:Interleukin-2 receptor subunit alpha n=1 Tax=Erinaceus europaeus TaxID=9365 RepID=A0ABM3XHV6_ERIEU|nr:interleukin-2 receptor subunit alpha isoform X2 [Erinaceus europaeus]